MCERRTAVQQSPLVTNVDIVDDPSIRRKIADLECAVEFVAPLTQTLTAPRRTVCVQTHTWLTHQSVQSLHVSLDLIASMPVLWGWDIRHAKISRFTFFCRHSGGSSSCDIAKAIDAAAETIPARIIDPVLNTLSSTLSQLILEKVEASWSRCLFLFL